MSDPCEAIKGRIQALQEELRTIPPHAHNAERIESRRRGLALCQAQLQRVEAMHQRWLDYRAELVARHHDFARNGGR